MRAVEPRVKAILVVIHHTLARVYDIQHHSHHHHSRIAGEGRSQQSSLQAAVVLSIVTLQTKVKVKASAQQLSSNLGSPLRGLACHGIMIQCQLPPGRGDIPAFTPIEAGTRFSDPGGRKVELTWWLVKHRGGLSVQRRSPIPALTGFNVEQLR